MNQKQVRLAILASGSGSNARNILEHFKGLSHVKVDLIASNKPDAGVLQHARDFGVETYILTKENFKDSDAFISKLKNMDIDAVILAGFLWKVPESLVKAYPNRILNIHPALLPKYGGKGMYGHFVHDAVFANQEKESGITIHFVNEHYDEGAILFQAVCSLTHDDTPNTIEQKVRSLEIQHFPNVIDTWIQNDLQ